MNNTATDTLQYFTPRVHNALANVVSAVFLFGEFASPLLGVHYSAIS